MPVMEQVDIAELVKETRRRLGLTQEKFASRLGVSFHSVNRWENGHTKPLPIALKQIEAQLRSMGARGNDLLDKYFSKNV